MTAVFTWVGFFTATIALICAALWLCDWYRRWIIQKLTLSSYAVRDYGYIRGLRYRLGVRLLYPYMERRAKWLKDTMDRQKNDPDVRDYAKNVTLGKWFELMDIYRTNSSAENYMGYLPALPDDWGKE